MKKLLIILFLTFSALSFADKFIKYSNSGSFTEGYELEKSAISDYVVIEGYSITDLKNSVMNYIKKGYIPLGGVNVSYAPMRTMYYQAMVLYE